MFGNLIKILLFAVVITSVALFTRERLQPSSPAGIGKQTTMEPPVVPTKATAPDAETTDPATVKTPDEAAPPAATEAPATSSQPPPDEHVGKTSGTGGQDAAMQAPPDTPPSETSAPAGAEVPDQQEAPSAATALVPARPGPDDATPPPADRAPVSPNTQ
jgi:hypothetical protein